MDAQLIFTRFTQVGDTSLSNLSAQSFDKLIGHLWLLKKESDSGRAAQIIQQLTQAKPLNQIINDFELLSISLKKQQINVSNKSAVDSLRKLLANYNLLFKNILVKEDLYRENLNTTIFKNAVTEQMLFSSFSGFHY